MKKIQLLLLSLFLATAAYSQQIQGTITDSDNNTIPYAAIYIKELKTGTTSNNNGNYVFKLAKGTYTITFQSLGYTTVTKSVTVTDKLETLNIVLPNRHYALKEVTVRKKKEDPAYEIIRKAISMAPYYESQIKKYSAKVYLKGTTKLENIPFLLIRTLKKEGIEEGKTYVEESVNAIKFQAPNIYRHTVLSHHSSMPNSNSDNVMNFINYNFYSSQNDIAISPISRNALRYYRYRYDGYVEHSNKIINKIFVKPKRKSQRLFSGYIYVVEDLWNLYAVDLQNKQFFGTINIKQNYKPIKDNAWLPVSNVFKLKFKTLGFEGFGTYLGSITYNNIVINKNLSSVMKPKKTTKVVAKELSEKNKEAIAKNNQKIETILKKEELNTRDAIKLSKLQEKNNRIMQQEGKESLEIPAYDSLYKVTIKVPKQDTTNWAKLRPIPLSEEEMVSMVKSDSIKLAKKDTTKNSNYHRSTFSKVVFGGSAFSKDSSWYISNNVLADIWGVGFNAVDGFTYKQRVNIRHKFNGKTLYINPTLKYGFARKKLMWNSSVGLLLSKYKHTWLQLWAGQESADFNKFGTESLTNSVYSLFYKKNYKRFYENNFVNISGRTDIANGLQLSANIGYRKLNNLENSTNFSLFRKNRDYTANNNIATIPIGAFNNAKAFEFGVGLRYVPRQRYILRGESKFDVETENPIFELWYKGAIANVLNSNTSYQLLEAQVTQHKTLWVLSNISYKVKAGLFLNKEDMHFSQFAHFNTNKPEISIKKLTDSFALLPNYEYSTNSNFLEAHFAYTTPYLLIKNIPFLQDKLWNETLYFNHLSTKERPNYSEIGYGISSLFLFCDIGVFAAFDKADYKSWGVKVSLSF